VQEDMFAETRYVNFPGGVEAKAIRNFKGRTTMLLQHKQRVNLISTYKLDEEIGKIYSFWGLVENEGNKGWVLLSCLEEDLSEINDLPELPKYGGIYKFDSINVIRLEETILAGYLEMLQSSFLEIKQLQGTLYSAHCYMPNYGDRTERLYLRENRKFLEHQGDRGPGGTELYFYFAGDEILLKYKYSMPIIDEDHDLENVVASINVEFEATFKRVEQIEPVEENDATSMPYWWAP
jgi:hypothetical protein